MRSLTPALAAILFVSAALAGTPHARLVGDGIVRYHADAQDASGALPTVLLKDEPADLGPAPGGLSVAPSFSDVSGFYRTRVTVATDAGTSLYGTGEVPGPLERTGRRTVLWNTDSYAWGDGNESLYQSHPWVLAVRDDGTAFGVLADTTYRTEIDLTGTDGEGDPLIAFTSQSPNLSVYVIDRASPRAVLEGLAELAGTMPMPPLWTMGYHQCRYSYYPDDRVLGVAQEFRSRDIPADVMWMDIDYMDGYRMFTWDPVGFPDPAGLDSDLDAIGFRSIAIVDPHLKVDGGYPVFQSGNANDVWVLDRFGNPFTGPVWPGDSRFPDYLRADVRDWWADLYPPFLSVGVDAVWNDMNEPAVFSSSKTMPEDNIHRADAALGGTDTHAATTTSTGCR
jgi:alpha-glucosidase